MSVSTQSALYERLFLLNRCLEQAAEIVEQMEREGLIHPEYAGHRRSALEELRADLSYTFSGLLHRRELETCVRAVRTEKGLGAEARDRRAS